jgi:hypothetical protein
MFSVPDYPVYELTDILLMPGLAVFFGLLIYFLGEFNEALKGGVVWKWVGIVIMALGALSGYRFFYAMVAPNTEGNAYRALMYSRKVIIANWGAFLFPLVCIVIAIVITSLRKKSASQRLLHDEF